MPQSIPASQLVQVLPNVLNAGGNALDINSIFLTNDTAIPINTVQPFATAADVATFFGSTSTEAGLAAIYFNGYEGSTQKPGTLFFAQYNLTNVAAYLRGGRISTLTLAQLQALGSGVLTVTIDGVAQTSATINLSGATSFSNAAALIQTGFGALVTAPVVTFDSVRGAIKIASPTTGAGSAFTTASSSASTTMNITSVQSGTVEVGQQVSGVGITAGTYIASFGTFNGTSGTVILNQVATLATNAQITTNASSISVASGTLAHGLLLDTGTTSQGAAPAVQASFMNNIVNSITQNWALFMTAWEPNLTDKEAFAAWVNGTNKRYGYVAWDTDVNAAVAGNTANFGYVVNSLSYDGVVPVYHDASLAAFICGAAASIDFNATNGAMSFSYKLQSGLTPNVTDATVASNLMANGYNFYGSYATANQPFTFLQPGQISGQYDRIDAYVNEIYLNSQLQLAGVELFASVPQIPDNLRGRELVRGALSGPIKDALNFGSIQTGGSLTSVQIAAVNNAAGVKIDDTLVNHGYYLQLGAAVRISPSIKVLNGSLWYVYKDTINRINLASVMVI